MNKTQANKKKTVPKAVNTGVRVPPTDTELGIISFRQRMLGLQIGVAPISTQQKIQRVQQGIHLLEEFHQIINKPDKDFYALMLKICIDFYRTVPNHHQHLPMLFKTVLHILDKAKDTELPQADTIYHFAIRLIEEHIKRNIEVMLQTSMIQEDVLSVSFEDIFDIFQQFIANIHYKKNRASSPVFDQHQIDIYSKFIFILTIALTTNTLSLPGASDVWKGVSSRILIKVFNQAEAANVPLKATSYSHMATAIACTQNPNIDILFHCFDKIKALGFFEPATDPKPQKTTTTLKDIQLTFCTVFFVGLQHVLDYDNAHTTAHFTQQHLRKAVKLITYLQKIGLLNSITPYIFDILARAPYHPQIDQSIKTFFQMDYPFTAGQFGTILKGLARSRTLAPEDLRFFFDYAVSHQFLQANNKETTLILEHLLKALAKVTEPLQNDVILYFDQAVSLQHDNPKSFDIIMVALTKVTPVVTEEAMVYCFNTMRSLHCFANPNIDSTHIVHNLLFCLEKIPAPTDGSFQLLAEYANHAGYNISKKVFARMIRFLERYPESCKQFIDKNSQLFEEYHAQQDLNHLYAELRIKLDNELLHEPYISFITANIQFADTLMGDSWDEHYFPSEKLNQLQALTIQLTRLQACQTSAKQHDVRLNHYYQRIQNELQTSHPNIHVVRTIVDELEVTLERAQQSAQALAEQLSLETIWNYIKSKDIDKLEKASVCLDRLINNQTEAHHSAHLVAKINCLINLGKYDKAMVWLERAKIAFPNTNDRSLRISFATCCKKIGQLSTAIAIRKQIHDELHQTKNTPTKLVNLLELAHCHILAAGYEHYQSALEIYTDLKTQHIPLSSEQILEIEVNIADCYIKLNQFKRAEEQLDTIPNGKNIGKVLLIYAWLYQTQRKHEQAKLIYLNLLSRQDNTEKTWRMLLRHCHTLPPKERALIHQHIRALLESTPIHNKTLQREKIMMLIQEKRFQEALDTLNQMILIWGKDESSFIGLAICHRNLQNVDRAIAMLTAFPDYSENRKIVMQLIECYQLTGDEKKLSICFDILLSRFQTYTLGIYKAMRYYCQQGDMDKIQNTWKQCRMYCKESILFRDIEQFVQPYLSESSPQPSLGKLIFENDSSIEDSILTRLELIDVFGDLDTIFKEQREEDKRRSLNKINVREIPYVLKSTEVPVISDLIKSLDLAIPIKFSIFKDLNRIKTQPQSNKELKISI